MGKALLSYTDLDRLTFAVQVGNALGFPPRKTVYLDSVNGSDNYDGLSPGPVNSSVTFPNSTQGGPKATLAAALALCTNNSGHAVVCMPLHAETLSATTQGIAYSASGVSIVGLGPARSRPAFTCGAADIVGILLSGNNNLFRNLRIIGSSSQTSTGSVLLSITGTDNVVQDCVFEHGAGPLGCILLAAAHRTIVERCRFMGTAAGPDFSIKTTGSAAPSNDCILRDLDFQYVASSGLDSGAIICHNTTGIPGWIMQRIQAVGMDVAVLDINGSSIATTVDSLATQCYGACSTATTTAAAWDQGSTMVTDSFWTDAIAAPPMWTGVAMRIAGTTGTIGAYPAGAGPT